MPLSLAFPLVVLSHVVLSAPLFPLKDEAIVPLRPGTSEEIFRDWSAVEAQPANEPDRSYRNIWVRMFPLLSQPLGDPYPETQDKNTLIIANSGGLKIYDLETSRLIVNGTVLVFDFKNKVVDVNGRNFTLAPLWIKPENTGLTLAQWDKGKVLPNGSPAEVRTQLRGEFIVKESIHRPRVIGGEYTLWSLINVVGVNEYLFSVVPSEVIASWHAETLKAQSIAARTYGLYEVALARNAGRDHDVDPSTWYQSYQGAKFYDRIARAWRDVELNATTSAVRATGTKVLMHRSQLIQAVFSSNSGGRTCTAGECLESRWDPVYLRAVDDAPGIQNAPGGTWGTRANLTPVSIRQQLISVGVTPRTTVKKLEHLERGPSGRTWRLRVVLVDGSTLDLTRVQTRKIMHLFGPIRSFMYTLGAVDANGRQSIKGFGFGHAVGMSQWGAQLFARQGWTAERILNHYYYDVSIQSLATP